MFYNASCLLGVSMLGIPKEKIKNMPIITEIHARQIIDSRGNPTIEVDVKTESGCFGQSRGPIRRFDLWKRSPRITRWRQEGFRYGKKAVKNVNEIIGSKIIGMDCRDQVKIDETMITKTRVAPRTKSNLAMLGVSLAVAGSRCRIFPHAALSLHRWPKCQEAFRSWWRTSTVANTPIRLSTSRNTWSYGLAPRVSQAIEMGAETFAALKKIFKDRKDYHGCRRRRWLRPEWLKEQRRTARSPRWGHQGCRLCPWQRYLPRHGPCCPESLTAMTQRRSTSQEKRTRRKDQRTDDRYDRFLRWEVSAYHRRRCSFWKTTGPAGRNSPRDSATKSSLSAMTSSSPIRSTSRRALRWAAAIRSSSKLNQIGTLTETLDTCDDRHEKWLDLRRLSPFWRDRRHHHRGPCCGPQCWSNQDWLYEPHRSHLQVQSTYAHRRRTWRRRHLSGPWCFLQLQVTKLVSLSNWPQRLLTPFQDGVFSCIKKTREEGRVFNE